VELYIFGRFHVRLGKEETFIEVLREVISASRGEPGCLEIHGYRSVRDERLFYLHSRWTNEDAFEAHARMPHTVKFVDQAEALIDHPLDVTRTNRIEE
jgi:quinol monooxygenase YgiN